jgi:hypothetical protein
MKAFEVGDRVQLTRVLPSEWTAVCAQGCITRLRSQGIQVKFDDGLEVWGFEDDELEHVKKNDSAP